MLGFDILDIANEGKVVIVVSAEKADECLQICKQCKNAKDAAIIGRVIKSDEPLVELLTKIEARRIIQMPSGRELPRIC
jgi:hydrogenase expression/formation protein HypE